MKPPQLLWVFENFLTARHACRKRWLQFDSPRNPDFYTAKDCHSCNKPRKPFRFFLRLQQQQQKLHRSQECEGVEIGNGKDILRWAYDVGVGAKGIKADKSFELGLHELRLWWLAWRVSWSIRHYHTINNLTLNLKNRGTTLRGLTKSFPQLCSTLSNGRWVLMKIFLFHAKNIFGRAEILYLTRAGTHCPKHVSTNWYPLWLMQPRSWWLHGPHRFATSPKYI